MGWARYLEPGGWIALTEVDDLFGHEPLPPRVKALLDAYQADALSAGRYDFHMGRKLKDHLERAGFSVVQEFTVADRELSFQGPAQPEVLDAWRARFARMRLLQEVCGPEFDQVANEFLACLASRAHHSNASVHCCIAHGRDARVRGPA